LGRVIRAASLDLPKDSTNIVVLHGELRDKSAYPDAIGLVEAAGRNIDYMALGHYHSHSIKAIDDRGVAVYSGTPEGRGFDETGEKGFLLLDVVGKKIERTFVPFAKRTFEEIDVDITGVKNFVDASQRIKPSLTSRGNCYRINLVGDVDESVKTDDIAERIKDLLSQYAFLIDVKDKTQIVLDLEKYKDDPTLKGEFIRVVLADEKMSAEQKNQVLATGLKALEGRLK
jgi:DNA repair exonuclease SbcCD nuclease subunit